MASPVLPYFTCRLCHLRNGVTLDEVLALFPPDLQKHVCHISLAMSPYPTSGESMSAVTTFKVDCVDGENVEIRRLEFGNRLLRINLTDPQYPHPIHLDDSFDGFTVLYEGIHEIHTDIIAVTGLGGDPFASWQCSTGQMWLRDFLPRDVPDCRVLTYGYPSKLTGNNSKAGLLDYVNNFVRRLKTIRQGLESRPVVFIGHSLGCLLIKAAIVQWSTKLLPGLPVKSIIFFGAPHKGMYVEGLQAQATSQHLGSKQLIDDLDQDSTILQYLDEAFIEPAKMLQILSCYETRPTPMLAKQGETDVWKRNGLEKMVVPRLSAILNLPNETRFSINSNHSMMAKLSCGPDSVYHDICRFISERIEHMDSTTNRELQIVNNKR